MPLHLQKELEQKREKLLEYISVHNTDVKVISSDYLDSRIPSHQSTYLQALCMLGLISEEQENYSNAVEYYQRLGLMKPT